MIFISNAHLIICCASLILQFYFVLKSNFKIKSVKANEQNIFCETLLPIKKFSINIIINLNQKSIYFNYCINQIIIIRNFHLTLGPLGNTLKPDENLGCHLAIRHFNPLQMFNRFLKNE